MRTHAQSFGRHNHFVVPVAKVGARVAAWEPAAPLLLLLLLRVSRPAWIGTPFGRDHQLYSGGAVPVPSATWPNGVSGDRGASNGVTPDCEISPSSTSSSIHARVHDPNKATPAKGHSSRASGPIVWLSPQTRRRGRTRSAPRSRSRPPRLSLRARVRGGRAPPGSPPWETGWGFRARAGARAVARWVTTRCVGRVSGSIQPRGDAIRGQPAPFFDEALRGHSERISASHDQGMPRKRADPVSYRCNDGSPSRCSTEGAARLSFLL